MARYSDYWERRLILVIAKNDSNYYYIFISPYLRSASYFCQPSTHIDEGVHSVLHV